MRKYNKVLFYDEKRSFVKDGLHPLFAHQVKNLSAAAQQYKSPHHISTECTIAHHKIIVIIIITKAWDDT